MVLGGLRGVESNYFRKVKEPIKPHFLSLFAPMSSDGHLYYIRHFYKKSQNSYQSWNSLEFNVSDNTAT